MHGIKDSQRVALIGALLVFVTVAIFWPLVKCEFINFDDDVYVTDNPHVQNGFTLAEISWAFHSTVASNWHPVTWLSHILDCEVYGLRPGGHHLTNVILHSANAVLLLVWLWRLTGAVWRSALVAALFAWHPLHVESVAWVAERKDVLSAFFGLLTLLCFQKFRRAGPKRGVYYAFAILFFTLGLLSKPMLVTLPFVLLLIDYWRKNERTEPDENDSARTLSWGKLVWEKIPFFILAAASCAVTFLAQKSGGAVESLNSLPLGLRIANAFTACLRYIERTFWPVNLAVFYPHSRTWELAETAIAAGVVLFISWRVIISRVRRPYLLVGWLWFLGTLVPVIGLVQVGRQSMADRYTYIPLIGLFIIVAWGLDEIREWQNRGKMADAHNRTIIIAAIFLLAGCATMTAAQIKFWRNSETLFKHAIEVTGDNYIACSNLGNFLAGQSRWDEAVFYFNEALRIDPSSADTEVNLGKTLADQGHREIGMDHLQKALKLAPNHALARFDLGNLLLQEGKTSEAIEQFRKAAQLRPDRPAAFKALGSALVQQGDLPQARENFMAALQGSPNDPQTHLELGGLLTQEHNSVEAVGHYREAARLYRAQLRLTPDSPELLNNLAWLLASNPYVEIRNGSEAVTLARRACDLTRWNRAIIVGTLAAAYAEAGAFDEAVKNAQRARNVALANGEKETAARNEELARQYRSGHPYREAF